MKWSKRKKRLNPNTLQLIRQIVGGLLVFIFVGLLVGGTWYVTRLPALTIAEVTVTGGETISHDLVTTLVESELEGEYLRLVPKRFSLMYPRENIVKAVEKIDRIKNISVERPSLTHLSISFDEFIPDALWCENDEDVCIFVDSTGFAFAKAPQLTGGSFLRLEKIGTTPVIDVQAFSTFNYVRVVELVNLLEQNDWFVKEVAVDTAGDGYFHLTEGGELKVALADEPERVVDNLFVVLSSPEFSEIGPGGFEYIDLRFGNKVFVNELEAEVATSSAIELE